MDALASIHHVPAWWLRTSDLAPFIPSYWQSLIAQRYSGVTARVYLCGVAHFARWAAHRRVAAVAPASSFANLMIGERCMAQLPYVPSVATTGRSAAARGAADRRNR